MSKRGHVMDAEHTPLQYEGGSMAAATVACGQAGYNPQILVMIRIMIQGQFIKTVDVCADTFAI
jgi:hypothetical protein